MVNTKTLVTFTCQRSLIWSMIYTTDYFFSYSTLPLAMIRVVTVHAAPYVSKNPYGRIKMATCNHQTDCSWALWCLTVCSASCEKSKMCSVNYVHQMSLQIQGVVTGNSLSAIASHNNWCTGTQDNYTTQGADGGCRVNERYESALLHPCPTIISVLSYSNCHRSTHSISKWIFRNDSTQLGAYFFLKTCEKHMPVPSNKVMQLLNFLFCTRENDW